VLREALAVVVDRTVLAAVAAVVPADPDAVMARQRFLQEGHLFGTGFLDAEDVRPDLLDGRPQGELPCRPVELRPQRAVVLAAVDVPGDDTNQVRGRLRRRARTGRAPNRPGDQPQPARQQPDEQSPRRPEETAAPALAAGSNGT